MAVNDIAKEMDKFFENVQRTIHTVDQITGEQFIREARQNDTYLDRTANLRNSIGYMAKSPESVSESANSEARKAIAERENELQGIGVVMVAGMNYAAAVESRGYDVISNSVEKAKVDHQRLMKKMLRI